MKKRILFVDDIKNVLNSLRLSLREMRDEWDMVFALGGEEAVNMLKISRFDLLVTDMRMPGIDGAQLLALANREHPSMGRIVLSGYAEQNCVLQNISLAHQYLSKPCTTQELVTTISNALNLDDSFENTKIKDVISSMESLPALPAIYRELTLALDDSDSSWRQICEIINKDMVLSATVLRVTNCAFFGLGGKVTGLDHAVKLLGTQTLRTLVYSTHLFSIFDQKTMPVFSVSKLWNHCLRVSVFAKLIATEENLPTRSRDDCVIAGMLHDIGKVVLSVIIPEDFKIIIDMVHEENCTVYEAEKNFLNVTHAEVGAYIMNLWGFKKSQIDAVKSHHFSESNNDESNSIKKILYAANIIDHEIVHISQYINQKKIKHANEEIKTCIPNYEYWREKCFEKITNEKLDERKSFLYK
ncbi:HDIG domain-containing protein [Desulfomicrobium apsheronum]|uniref:HDIG domain-containing protein n=1 Tax=Desulfomicrobium apsheronum TaxID=52560 RepID=A0A1I3VXZ6_9BACT|nr:response regulator [Desulfomicrobium apsheronum]SFJ99051.1 HDIG domain-containing protein [Desulfomicrobium apsheronum]